jgi:hypothetical protein
MFFEIKENIWVKYEDIQAFSVEREPASNRTEVTVYLPQGHPFKELVIKVPNSRKLQYLLYQLVNGPERVNDDAGNG